MLALMDGLPLWALFALPVLLVLGAVELGFRLGAWRHRVQEKEKESAVGAVGGATVALLGFMLVFTFSLAASRFDARRQVVLEESNAIGTAWLRTELLPEPQRSASRALFVEYVDQRLAAARGTPIEDAVRGSERVQG
jgi:hypothetical protein